MYSAFYCIRLRAIHLMLSLALTPALAVPANLVLSDASDRHVDQFELQLNSNRLAVDYLEPVLSSLRLDAEGDPHLLNLLRKVALRTSLRTLGAGNALTFLTDERTPLVEVDATLILAAVTFGILEKSPEKVVERYFFDYDRITRITYDISGGLPPLFINLEEFVTNPVKRKIIKSMAKSIYEPAIAWIVLHEIAHHVLPHFESPPADEEESRKIELEADMWAARKLEELGYPIMGLAVYTDYMALMEKQVYAMMNNVTVWGEYAALNMEKLGASSTHPSWRSRHNALLNNFDVMALPDSPYLSYRVIDSISIADGSDQDIDVLIFFPVKQRASRWGAAHLVSNLPDLSGMAWVQYENHSAIVYSKKEKGRLQITLDTPGTWGSNIQIEYYAGKKAPLYTIETYGWYESNAKYDADEMLGMPYKKIYELTPHSTLSKALIKLEVSPGELDAVRRQLMKCQVQNNQTLTDFHSGHLSPNEFDDRYQANQLGCNRAIEDLIGDSRFSELQKLWLEDNRKIVDWAVQRARDGNH